jgi:hypothetical protein
MLKGHKFRSRWLKHKFQEKTLQDWEFFLHTTLITIYALTGLLPTLKGHKVRFLESSGTNNLKNVLIAYTRPTWTYLTYNTLVTVSVAKEHFGAFWSFLVPICGIVFPFGLWLPIFNWKKPFKRWEISRNFPHSKVSARVLSLFYHSEKTKEPRSVLLMSFPDCSPSGCTSWPISTTIWVEVRSERQGLLSICRTLEKVNIRTTVKKSWFLKILKILDNSGKVLKFLEKWTWIGAWWVRECESRCELVKKDHKFVCLIDFKFPFNALIG